MQHMECRGKSRKSEIWHYGYLCWDDSLPNGDGWMIRTTQGVYFAVDRETIGQWTGRKDCNGVKLFAGDRFNWIDWPGTYTARWDDDFMAWHADTDTGGVSPLAKFFTPYAQPQIIIVGNIYNQITQP